VIRMIIQHLPDWKAIRGLHLNDLSIPNPIGYGTHPRSSKIGKCLILNISYCKDQYINSWRKINE